MSYLLLGGDENIAIFCDIKRSHGTATLLITTPTAQPCMITLALAKASNAEAATTVVITPGRKKDDRPKL
jgi:hypothetical protein